ncbi:hypothetical protein CPB86DRAFT_374227 [Serendipita vermifera]|nr:hypothetical protein CPB86DRAFT_374227 [Serendipita vermifera]
MSSKPCSTSAWHHPLYCTVCSGSQPQLQYSVGSKPFYPCRTSVPGAPNALEVTFGDAYGAQGMGQSISMGWPHNLMGAYPQVLFGENDQQLLLTWDIGAAQGGHPAGMNTVMESNPARGLLVPPSGPSPPTPLNPQLPSGAEPYSPTPTVSSLQSLNTPVSATQPPVNWRQYSPYVEDLVDKYQCRECGKQFNRKSRSEACFNRHYSLRPHKCPGQCGDPDCRRAYQNIETLRRHCRPSRDRELPCKN